jgi:hypothetical protein
MDVIERDFGNYFSNQAGLLKKFLLAPACAKASACALHADRSAGRRLREMTRRVKFLLMAYF